MTTLEMVREDLKKEEIIRRHKREMLLFGVLVPGYPSDEVVNKLIQSAKADSIVDPRELPHWVEWHIEGIY